jgi:hypothetical protein
MAFAGAHAIEAGSCVITPLPGKGLMLPSRRK